MVKFVSSQSFLNDSNPLPSILFALTQILDTSIEVSLNCITILLHILLVIDLDFIRAEGFVFSHIGDEGFIDSCAADLIRYRKAIGAENVKIFTDIKKKHR